MLPDGLGLKDGETDGEALGLSLAEEDKEIELLGLRDGLALDDCDNDALAESEALADLDCEELLDALGL